MEKELLEQRKQILTELMDDKAYVPMKAKELAILLNIPKSQREGLVFPKKGNTERLRHFPSTAYSPGIPKALAL